MKRTVRHPKPKKTAAIPGRSPSQEPSTALVVVDNREIRQKTQKDYEKVRAKLSESQQTLDRFHRKDRPAFSQWFHRKFGKTLTEIRNVQQQLFERQELLWEIEDEQFRSDCTFQEAHRRVMRRRESPAPEPEHEDAGSSHKQSHNHDDPFADLGGQFDDFAKTFQQFFEFTDEPDSNSSAGRMDTEPKHSAPARVKELYRKVVRKLHPDSQQNMSPRHTEWWHQAQEAYQKNDAEQLEVILALCELEDQKNTKSTSISILTQIIRQFRRSLRKLQAQIRQCREDPAWDFSTRRDVRILSARIETELTENLASLQNRLHVLEHQFEVWSKPPVRRQSRRGAEPFSQF